MHQFLAVQDKKIGKIKNDIVNFNLRVYLIIKKETLLMLCVSFV